MSEGEDKDNKTEEPSEQKLRKAREKGDVPSSKEAGNMTSVFALFLLALFALPAAAPPLAEALGGLFSQAGTIEVGSNASGLGDLGEVVDALTWPLAVTLAPALAIMVALAIFGVLIQGEVVVSGERIKPKLSKINPAQGLKRLFSAETGVEFVKNLAKVGVVAGIGIWVARGAVTDIWEMPGVMPEALPEYLRQHISRILLGASVFLVPLAIFDVIWKRHRWREKQKMSIKEVRDEHKDSEGDPMIRQQRARLRRERAQQRISQSVPTATVILTNPTHYAVALRYEMGQDLAPVCVAKGTDLMAAQIRKLARESEVPVLENKPLARALHATVEVDQQIPAEHWQAIAEIIRYVMDLRDDMARKPPPGTAPHVEA
ncbi:flagellar biosynthesis protein FlhB [Roseivivax halodurans JCM 10272]|uniref:Flagellar biosynthesis protein FlhB n=1 Tax=Roseivivax halodurans JCM 10272 TaxID=1449350 RepID=X7EK95_9RHOB|nr:flagellar type III secretion system protein FlhB [Roseivivax halodurans]ETX16300.1 flagellar biosynthesis protein FlhB [Roseivivax halodurans JCM 10272]